MREDSGSLVSRVGVKGDPASSISRAVDLIGGWSLFISPGERVLVKGLFNSAKLPDSGLPVTDENVRERIVNGGDKMPPFKHLKEGELKAIVDYLKTL